MSAQQLRQRQYSCREAEPMPVTLLCLAGLSCCMAQWQQGAARLSWPSWERAGGWKRQGPT